jgi:hypothetical protein
LVFDGNCVIDNFTKRTRIKRIFTKRVSRFVEIRLIRVRLAKRMLMKNILKYGLRILLAIITFAIIYWIAQFALSRLSVAREADTKPEVTIFIRSNGVHTDLVLPVKNEAIHWNDKILFAHTTKKDSNMNYIGLGWGDKGFYLETPTWAELKFLNYSTIIRCPSNSI